MDVRPLIEYFQPLLDWLKTQNAGHPTGWTEECPQQELVEAAQWLQDYNEKLEEKREESTFADWNYTSNITDETSVKSVKHSRHVHICVSVFVFLCQSALILSCRIDWAQSTT